jgi:hypothetical protein
MTRRAPIVYAESGGAASVWYEIHRACGHREFITVAAPGLDPEAYIEEVAALCEVCERDKAIAEGRMRMVTKRVRQSCGHTENVTFSEEPGKAAIDAAEHAPCDRCRWRDKGTAGGAGSADEAYESAPEPGTVNE